MGNAKELFEDNKERIEEIQEEINLLKKEKAKLKQENDWLLADNCTYRDEVKGKCTYDNTPLNKEGYYCTDCVSANYSHIKIKEE